MQQGDLHAALVSVPRLPFRLDKGSAASVLWVATAIHVSHNRAARLQTDIAETEIS